MKIRKGVAAIRKSPQRREIFAMHCTSHTLKHKMLILDVKTRWNSTYWMLTRCIEFRKPFQATLQSISSLKKFILDEIEWKKVEEITKLLNLFREATEMLSTQSSPTLSSTSSVYSVLFDHLDKSTMKTRPTKTSTHEEDWFQRAVKAGKDKLHKYYPTADGLSYIGSTGK